MPTLAELLTPRTRQQWRDLLLNELRDAGFAVALAPSGDNRRNVVEFIAGGLAKVDETIGNIAKGAYLDTALGEWLRLRVKSGYVIEPKPATMTVGTVRLTCSGTAGPYTVGPGQLWVGRAAAGSLPARRFQNTTGGLLASGGTLDVRVSAEFPGSAFNLGNLQIAQMFTALPGVQVSNPAVGMTGTWIDTPGTDPEIDQPEALRQRARDKWGTQGRLANLDAYRFIVTSATPEITRAGVYPGAGDGTLQIILAGATGTVSSGAVIAAQQAVALLKAGTDTLTIRAANVHLITPTGAVFVRNASLGTAQVAADAARLALLRTLDVGFGLDLGALYAILRQPGVVDVDLVTPSGDTPIAYDEVVGIDLSALTWTGV